MDTMHTTPPVRPAAAPGSARPTSARRHLRAAVAAAAPRLAVGPIEQLERRQLYAVTGLNNATWTELGSGLVTGSATLPGTQTAAGSVTGIATDPADANTFYVATRGGGVWKTTNGGTSYTETTDTLPALNIGAIAISASNPNVVYAGTGNGDQSSTSTYGQGILRTVNGGATWELLGQTQFARQSVATMAVDPTNPQIVYASVQDGQLYGVTATTGTAATGGLATPPAGIYKSIDGGSTWTDLTSGISTDDAFYDVQIDPTTPTTLYASFQNSTNGQSGVYKSVDGGSHFNMTGSFPILPEDLYVGQLEPQNGSDSSGLSQDTFQGYGRVSLAVSPTSPDTVYASVASFYATGQIASGGGDGQLVIPDPNDPTIATFLEPGYLLVSNDGGASWNQLDGNIDEITDPTQLIPTPVYSGAGEDYNSIIVSRTNPDLFFAGGAPVPPALLNLNVFTGTAGSTNTSTNANAGELYQFTRADPTNLPNDVTATDFTSNAAGTTGPGQDITSFSYDADNRLLVGTDQGVFRLEDPSAATPTWTNLSGNINAQTVRSIAVVPSAGDEVIAAANTGGLQRLSGTSATAAAAQLPGLTGILGQAGLAALDVVVNPIHPNDIVVTTNDRYDLVYRSTDGGQTFTPAISGLNFPDPTVDVLLVDTVPATQTLVADPDNPDRLLLGVDNALYESMDDGANWTEVDAFTIPSQNGPIPVNISTIAVGNHGSVTLFNPSTTHTYVTLVDGTTYESDNDFTTAPTQIDLPTTDNAAGVLNTAQTDLGTQSNPALVAADNLTLETVTGAAAERLVVDPVNSSTVFAVVGGFSTATSLGSSTGSGGHIYMSTSSGIDAAAVAGTDPNVNVNEIQIQNPATTGVTTYLGGAWTDITSNLPNIPVHALAVLPSGINGFTRTLYAGTDRGVYVSYNDGGTWAGLGAGLPTAPVYDLAVDAATGVLIAGTNGRGVWELSTARPAATISSRVFSDVNATGLSDPSEPGVAGALVTLHGVGPDGLVGTADDTTVASQRTGTSGAYSFTNLAVGTYYVHIDAPGTYYLSPEYTGAITPAATPSQLNGLTGYTPAATLGSAVDAATGNSAAVAITDTGTLTPTAVTGLAAGVYQKTIIVNNPSVTRTTADTTATFTVTISPANQLTTVTVPYTTANGTAVAGTDYTPVSGTLTFAPGVSSQTVTVTIPGVATPQVNKNFSFDVTAPTGYVSPDVTNNADIINGVFPTVNVGAASITRSDIATGTVGVPVTLVNAATGTPETAPFDVFVDVTAVPGTAGATTDFNNASYAVLIPAGTTSAIAYFTVLPGTNPQVNKTFVVSPSNATGAVVGAYGTVTIVSNTLPTVTVSNATVTPVVGQVSTLDFTVSLPAPVGDAVTVNYATTDGTAIAGTDYRPVTGTLTFKPGQVSQVVSVPVLTRAVAAQSLTLGLTLSAPSDGVQLPATPTATGTIVDTGTSALTATSAGRPLTYVDNLGQKVTLTVRGGGSASVVYSGSSPATSSGTTLVLTGTNAATSVTFKVARGGQTSFTNIEIDGAVRTFNAKQVNLTNGSFTATGGAAAITLGYMAGSTMTLGGTVPVALAFTRVVDSSINSTAAIRSLSAGAYVNSDGVPDTITAPTVNARRVKGHLGATIVQTAVA